MAGTTGWSGSVGNQVSDAKSIVSLGLKISVDSHDDILKLSSEGMTEVERENKITSIAEICKCDIFEFSTCNRVLFVGFNTSLEKLENAIRKLHPTVKSKMISHEGIEAWSNLVTIASGLDSLVLGELQVMGQFRKAINWHRSRNLIGQSTSEELDTVISANRRVRRILNLNHTTRSMFTLALDEVNRFVESQGNKDIKIVVLGCGEMGSQAIFSLLDLGLENILVANRSVSKAKERLGSRFQEVTAVSMEDWLAGTPVEVDLIISILRRSKPLFDSDYPLITSTPCTILDFSWPPSVDPSAINSSQNLLGMKHWIKAAHGYSSDKKLDEIKKQSISVIEEVVDGHKRLIRLRSSSEWRRQLHMQMRDIVEHWDAESTGVSHEHVERIVKNIAHKIGKTQQTRIDDEIIRSWITEDSKGIPETSLSQLLGIVQSIESVVELGAKGNEDKNRHS